MLSAVAGAGAGGRAVCSGNTQRVQQEFVRPLHARTFPHKTSPKKLKLQFCYREKCENGMQFLNQKSYVYLPQNSPLKVGVSLEVERWPDSLWRDGCWDTVHRECLLGGMLGLSGWYTPGWSGFPYPNTFWHWRLCRSPGSGGRPGQHSHPTKLTMMEQAGYGRDLLSGEGRVTLMCREGSRDYSLNPFLTEKSFQSAWLQAVISPQEHAVICGGSMGAPLPQVWVQKKKKSQAVKSISVAQQHACQAAFLPPHTHWWTGSEKWVGALDPQQ